MKKVLYSIYQIVIAAPIFLILTILTAVTTIIGSIFNSRFWGYYPGKIWSMLTCYLLFLPVKVKGYKYIHKKTSYVFVANHQGAFDIFLIYGFLGQNFKWMMKQGLRKLPFVGKACASAGHIYVDKSSPKKIQETIEKAYYVLQDGMSLVVFPEGARTFTGKMSHFKKGAYFLADELQLPVVPLTINGSFNVLPRTGKLIKRHPLKLTIHEPIYPTSKGSNNIKDLIIRSFDVINNDLPKKYQAHSVM
jgi:1-acyl-sn-glycerol-3-phosphate acyltransferase